MTGRTFGRILTAAALVCALVPVPVADAASDITDPYEVLSRHYEALGGLDALRAEESLHFEATFSVSGLEGTVRHWEARPDRSRTEVDLVVFSQTTGDNGTTAWEVDGNGKLRIEQDPGALARREVGRRLALFEHLDPASDAFTVTLSGTEQVDGADCYVVRVSSESDHVDRTWYIDVADFLLRKSVDVRPDMQQHAVHSDYREVNGVLHAFRQDIEMLPIGQRQTMVATLFETNVDIDPGLFDPPSDEARDFVFTDGGNRAEVPFQFMERHIFLPVTVDCREALWVLDSGASSSVIDREYAERLGLEMSGEVKGQGAGNTVDVAFTTLPPFSIDGIEFEEQQIAVIELVGLFRKISDLEVVGVLGYDFLSRFVTRVDYANSMLTFYDPEEFEYEGDGTVLDAPLKENLFTVAATVDGVHEGRWMLDLGAGGMTFHAPYAKEHDLASREGVFGVGFGAGGRLMHYLSEYETVEFAGYTLPRPRISMAGHDGELEGAFSGGELVGNLGSTLLRHFVLYLDYGKQKVVVEKGDDFGATFPWDASGLQLWRPDEVCEVLYVSPGTPADEAGFREGDTVLTINGIGVEHFGGLLAFRDMLRGEPGTEYVFVVDRYGQRNELTLVLRDLL
ncbi:MAG: aspartyl protease family protein [Candidatus Eisenbacteria bacterium]